MAVFLPLHVGAVTDRTPGEERAVFFSATMNGDLAGVRAGLQRGGNPTDALLFAIGPKTSAAIVAALLRAGADANAEHDGVTPLHQAAMFGQRRIVELLAAAGADLETRDHYTGETPIMTAAACHRTETVRALIGLGAKVNARSNAGGTALSAAARSDSVAITRFLLKHGADPHVDDQDELPLALAAWAGHDAVVSELLARQPTSYELNSALDLAVRDGDVSTVDLLVKAGASVNNRDSWQPPLAVAAEKGRPAIVRALLDHGADINQRVKFVDSSGPDDGKTALIYAAENGHNIVVGVLLRAGADAGISSADGTNALAAAIKSRDARTIQLLQMEK